MSHISREKLDLVNRAKKVSMAMSSAPRSFVVSPQSVARSNSLMGELMEDHILNHMPKNSKSSEEAAEDIVQIIRTYLK